MEPGMRYGAAGNPRRVHPTSCVMAIPAPGSQRLVVAPAPRSVASVTAHSGGRGVTLWQETGNEQQGLLEGVKKMVVKICQGLFIDGQSTFCPPPGPASGETERLACRLLNGSDNVGREVMSHERPQGGERWRQRTVRLDREAGVFGFQQQRVNQATQT